MSSIHRDRWGLIVQADGDGGDTAQRTGFYYFARFLLEGSHFELRQEFFPQLRQLLPLPGVLVRHPDQSKWWSDPKKLSRDQWDVVICAAAALGEHEIVERMYARHRSQFFIYQNGDLPTLQTFSVYGRALRWSLWRYTLLISDMGLLLNSLAIWISARKNPNDTDDLNHIARLAQAWHCRSTLVSWAARKLYARLRPHSAGSSLAKRNEVLRSSKFIAMHGVREAYEFPRLENHRVMGVLTWYFGRWNGGNPEIAETWRPIVWKLFS